MRLPGSPVTLSELQTEYELLREKKHRLEKNYLTETDFAMKFKFEKLIKQSGEELKKLEQEIELIEESAGHSKGMFNPYPSRSLEAPYDVFFCYHPAERNLVQPIASKLEDDQHLKVLLYGAAEKGEDLYLVNSVAVFVGEIEPWRDNDLNHVLAKFTNRKIPMINVILENIRKDPYFPIFLRSNRFVDFRKRDPDPIAELEKLIKEIKGQHDSD